MADCILSYITVLCDLPYYITDKVIYHLLENNRVLSFFVIFACVVVFSMQEERARRALCLGGSVGPKCNKPVFFFSFKEP